MIVWKKIFGAVLYSKDVMMGRACGLYGRQKGSYKVFVGRPAGNRPLGRPVCRWKDNIKMDLQGGGLGGMDWLYLVEDRDNWLALLIAEMIL
jgi:hypothetical protein